MTKQDEIIAYNLRIPKKLKTKAEKQAKAEKRSLNQHIVHILESVLVANKEQKEVVF